MIKANIWKNTTKEGKPYLSGNIFGLKVMIFPNDDKKTDTSPDYTLIVDMPKERKADGAGEKESQF